MSGNAPLDRMCHLPVRVYQKTLGHDLTLMQARQAQVQTEAGRASLRAMPGTPAALQL